MPDDDATPGGGGGEAPNLGPDIEGYGGIQFPIRRTTRPSLDTLQNDQRVMIYDGDASRVPPIEPIIDGFDNRRQLINWYQAATVRTFGHLSDWWPAVDLERDRALRDALTKRRPHDDAGARWLHSRLIESVVLPACSASYRHLREKSSERTAIAKYADDGDDWKEIDPTAENHIGMRPAYSQLDGEQAEVLSELWGGFGSRDEIGEWLHSLHPATYGTYGAGEAGEILRDRYGTEMFLTHSREAELHRERFAIVELLPRFAEAARRLRASEQSETEPDDTWRHG